MARKPAKPQLVLYRTSYPEEQWGGAAEHSAVITGVASDTVVTLTVFPEGEAPVTRNAVRLEGSFTPLDGFPSCSWAWPNRQ